MDFPTCLLFTLYTRTRAVATLLIVVVLILVVPWYPVVSNQLVNQTFTYTYQNQSQTLQTQKVYTLPSIIFLQGLFQSGATLDQVSKNLGDVSLQADSLVHVQATQCQYCGVNISQDIANVPTVYSSTGSGTGDFMVAKTGQYKISVLNMGYSTDQVSAISITADVPQNTMQTEFGYNTVGVNQYSVKSVPAYAVLGTLLSLAIIVVLAIFLVLAVIVDLELVRVSTGRRKRRR